MEITRVVSRMSKPIFFLLWLFILIHNSLPLGPPKTGEKSWTYYFVSTDYRSSNEDLLKINLEVERVSRGIYGITGELVMNMDIDDNSQIEANAYRSATGSSDYTKLPFSLERQHLYDFFNSFYKNIIMPSIGNCSNMPQFEDEFKPPFEKKTYTFNQCQVSNDGLPQHMQEGYYKVALNGYGSAEYYIEFVVKVETAL